MNLNSLMNKVNYLLDLVCNVNVGICCVCETWLNSDVLDSLVSLPGYKFFRNDSPTNKRIHGVGMYVHDNIKVGKCFSNHPNTVGVFLPDFNVTVLAVYRPPSYTLLQNIALISYLELFHDSELILVGDFNLPSITWSADVPCGSSSLDVKFLDLFTFLGLIQWIKQPTFLHSDNILDLIFTSESDRIANITFFDPFPGCDHFPITFDYLFNRSSTSVNNGFDCFNFYKGNYNLINSYLLRIDWESIFLGLTVDDAYSRFKNAILETFKLFLPLKQPVSCKKVPWIRSIPRSVKQRKRQAWLQYKDARSKFGRLSPIALRLWQTFRSVSVEFCSLVQQRVINYEKSLVLSVNSDAKRLHSYLRNKKVQRPTIGPLCSGDGWSVESVDMANQFVEAFSQVFTSTELLNPFPVQQSNSRFIFNSDSFDIFQVQQTLYKLKPSASTGPDGIPSVFLKRCAPSISYPLLLLFRKSLSSMQVPSDWKDANVMPLFKGGVHSDPLNYRPISLTSVCCKTFERIITSQLSSYLEVNNLLSSHQYGFRSGRSVSDQLLYAYEYVTQSYDNGLLTDVIFFDFRKAFDVVNHVLLLNMLSSIGVEGCLLGWLRDYLLGRKMKVVVHGSQSHQIDISSGVPQGSVIGPLLFLIYINHVVSQLSCKFCLFADDLKLYLASSISKSDYLISHYNLQKDIDLLYNTSSSWGLSFSVSKCVRMYFCRNFYDVPIPLPYHINNEPIKDVDNHKDLGVRVDTSLKFHLHVREIAGKAGGISYTILKGTMCRSPDFMKTVFITHIRPILDFASVAWFTGYSGDIKLLEGIQRRWTKRIDGFQDLQYSERLARLSLFSIKGRLIRADLIMVFKILKGFCPHLDHLLVRNTNRVTRGHSLKLSIPRCATDVRARFFAVRVVNLWNGLPESAVSAVSVAAFKHQLNTALGQVLYDHA